MWRAAFLSLMVLAVFCSIRPQHQLVALGLTMVAFIALALPWLRAPTLPRSWITAGLALLFIAIGISLPVALSNGTSFYDWALRGAAPFAFLVSFAFLPLRSVEDIQFIYRAILAAVVVWCAVVAVDLADNVPRLMSTRWTRLADDMLLPYDLVGLAILLFAPQVVPRWARYGFLLVLLIAIIGSGYRSHFAIGAVLLLAFVVQERSGRRWRSAAAAVLLAMLAWSPFQAGGFAERVFTTAWPFVQPADAVAAPNPALRRGDVGRIAEFKYALTQFAEAPLLGKGLSYPVPAADAYAGREIAWREAERRRGGPIEFVYMVHSTTLTVAMSMGLVGLAALAVIGLGVLRETFFVPAIIVPRRELLPAFVALASLVASGEVSAAVTLLQFHLLIAAFCAVLAVNARRWSWRGGT